MRKQNIAAALAVAAVLLGSIPSYSQSAYYEQSRPGFFHRHPWLGAAGVGAMTGGVGGVLLGGKLLHGAAVGAGTHTGFHYLHEKWIAHKQRRGYY
jgi:hypothetical protein